MLFGGILTLISVVPAVPWRYSRADTNVGNRFVMDRTYSMMGFSDNLGKRVSWFKMAKKFKRKSEEFGRPSPISALLGTASQALGTGGAAMGCSVWDACKQHVNQRYMSYTSMAWVGIISMIMLIFGAVSAAVTCLMLNFEADAGTKKKKKKKEEECMNAGQKTMLAANVSFMLVFIATSMFVCMSGSMLKEFQQTAYYPYAGAYAGAFVASGGAFFLFIGAMTATNRSVQCCSRRKPDEENEALMYGGAGAYAPPPGAYGAPPGAYGAPPGAYGAPPGAYGAPAPGQGAPMPAGKGQW